MAGGSGGSFGLSSESGSGPRFRRIMMTNIGSTFAISFGYFPLLNASSTWHDGGILFVVLQIDASRKQIICAGVAGYPVVKSLLGSQ